MRAARIQKSLLRIALSENAPLLEELCTAEELLAERAADAGPSCLANALSGKRGSEPLLWEVLRPTCRSLADRLPCHRHVTACRYTTELDRIHKTRRTQNQRVSTSRYCLKRCPTLSILVSAAILPSRSDDPGVIEARRASPLALPLKKYKVRPFGRKRDVVWTAAGKRACSHRAATTAIHVVIGQQVPQLPRNKFNHLQLIDTATPPQRIQIPLYDFVAQAGVGCRLNA